MSTNHSSRLTRAGFVAFGVIVLSLALAGRATAESKKEQAEAHYDQGKAYYKAGAYDLAIQEFLEGYKLAPRAGVLFNIARGYEELKDKNKAVEFYQKYIDLGAQATAAPEARARLIVLERQLKEEEGRKKAEAAERERQQQPSSPPPAMPPPVATVPPVAATSPVTAAPAVSEKPADAATAPAPSGAGSGPEGTVTATAPEAASAGQAHALKVGGLVTGGAGVVLVGVGAFFLVRGGGLKDDINGEVARTHTWTADLSSKDADRKTDNTLGAISLIAGAVVAAGGALLFVLGAQQTPHEGAGATASLTPVVGPGGGALLVTGHF